MLNPQNRILKLTETSKKSYVKYLNEINTKRNSRS